MSVTNPRPGADGFVTLGRGIGAVAAGPGQCCGQLRFLYINRAGPQPVARNKLQLAEAFPPA